MHEIVEYSCAMGSYANFRSHQDLPFCSICKIWSSRSEDT